MPAQPAPRVSVARQGVLLAGRLGRKTFHHLVEAIWTLSNTGHPRRTKNAAALDSCDSTDLRALIACCRKALRHGGQLTVVAARPFLVAALAAVRLDGHVMADRAFTAGGNGSV